MMKSVTITVHGERKNGEATEDVVELTKEQWEVITELVRTEVTIQEEEGNPKLEETVELLCNIDWGSAEEATK